MHGHQKPVQAGGHKQQLPKGTGASVRPGECGGAGTGRGSPGTAPGATQRPGGWRGRQQPVGTQSTAQPARTELLAQASREGVPEGCWSLREVTIKKGLDWNPQVLATHLSLCSHHEEPCDREHRVGGRGNRQTAPSPPLGAGNQCRSGCPRTGHLRVQLHRSPCSRSRLSGEPASEHVGFAGHRAQPRRLHVAMAA